MFGWFNTHRYSSPTNELYHVIKSKINIYFVAIVFHSFEAAYFIGFLPVKFIIQEEIYFDPYCTLCITLFFWLNSSLFLVAHFMRYKAGELHHQALQLGRWKKLSVAELEKQFGTTLQRSFIPLPYQVGNKYHKGCFVVYNGLYYEAMEASNTCKPGEVLPSILYVLRLV